MGGQIPSELEHRTQQRAVYFPRINDAKQVDLPQLAIWLIILNMRLHF